MAIFSENSPETPAMSLTPKQTLSRSSTQIIHNQNNQEMILNYGFHSKIPNLQTESDIWNILSIILKIMNLYSKYLSFVSDIGYKLL